MCKTDMGRQILTAFALCCIFVVCIVNCCEDKNPSCQYWASVGECDKNPNYMLPNCQISCHQCGNSGGGSSSGCVDQSPSCPGWASAGECVSNPAYMFGHCQKSCDSCGVTIVG